MDIEQRVKMCLLIEKMQRQKMYSEKLGIEDVSRLHGEPVHRQEEKKRC